MNLNERMYMGYRVKNDGTILNKEGTRELKQEMTIKKLKRVTLTENGYKERVYVHKLIWVLFCNGSFEDKVSHIDGNLSNNKDSNLELMKPTRRKRYV